MFRRKLVSLAFCLMGGLSLAGVGSAANEMHHAALCNPLSTSDAAKIGYSRWGIHNNSETQSATISCGAILPEQIRRAGVSARVYDRHGTQDVCCTARWQDRFSGDTLSAVSACTGGFDSAMLTLSMSLPAQLVHNASLECTIPPKTANGLSHVAAWVVN